MKQQARIFGGALLAMGLLAGCQTAQEVNDEYEEYAKKPQAVEVIVSGDKAIDAIGKTSAEVNRQTNLLLEEYLVSTNIKYRHFMGAVDQKVKDLNMPKEKAIKALQDEYMATEEGKAEWKDIEAGRNALDPARKLAEITPLLASAGEVLKNASDLKNSFSGFDATTMKKVAAVKKIQEQAEHSREALNFLQRFYLMNLAIPRSN